MSMREAKFQKRRLRMEALEDRTLLSVTVAAQTFKSMDAAGTLTLKGTLTGEGVWGTWNATAKVAGTIEYHSAQNGIGWGTASGSGNYKVHTILGETYTGKLSFSGTGSGQDNGGAITGSGSGSAWGTTEFGPFSGTGGGDGHGTFNASNFYTKGSGSGDVGIGQGTVNWSGTLNPTETKPFNLAITASWVDPKHVSAGARVSVNVSGKVHKAPSARGAPVAKVEMYWARVTWRGTQKVRAIADKIPVYWNQASGAYVVHHLPSRPANATHLVFAAKFDGKTRSFALPLRTPSVPRPPAQDSYLSVDQTCWLPDDTGEKHSYTGADIVRLKSDGAGHYGYASFLDGSDVGLDASGDDIDAFALLPDGSILVSTVGTYSVQTEYAEPGIGNGVWLRGSGEDILRFVPTGTGEDTAGTWELYFDGSDVGLNRGAGNIDALAVLADESLLVSVAGSLRPSGFSTPVQPADVLRFVPTSLGDQTAGTWSRYFRGADVGLSGPSEDIDAIDVTLTDAGATTLLLSTRGNFSVPGLSGSKEDVFAFTFRGQPRLPTVGTFSRALVLDGSRFGLSGLNLDAFSRVPPLAPSAQLDAALQTGTSDPESLSKSDLALGALDYAMHLQERKDPPSE